MNTIKETEQNHNEEHEHPTPLTYLKIAIALVVITIIEVALFYIPALKNVLVLLLIILSVTKFALVALFYMHLKFDSRLFSGFFFGGLLLATLVITALVVLFNSR